MYCKECGNPIEDDSKFCKHCGKTMNSIKDIKSESVLVPESITTKAEITRNNICCPKYKHFDNIAKVSFVYSSGVSEGRYSGTAISLITPFSSNDSSSVAITPISMGGINISELSKRIAPPPEPQRPSRALFIIFLILGILSLLSLFGSPFVVVFGPLAAWQGIKHNNLNLT